MLCLQVTESIPKSIFDKANRLRKTCYLKATQVPRVGGKQVHTAYVPSTTQSRCVKKICLTS